MVTSDELRVQANAYTGKMCNTGFLLPVTMNTLCATLYKGFLQVHFMCVCVGFYLLVCARPELWHAESSRCGMWNPVL